MTNRQNLPIGKRQNLPVNIEPTEVTQRIDSRQQATATDRSPGGESRYDR